MDVKPRTSNDMLSELLQLTLNGEWSGQYNTACHCHPEYAACCPECEEYEKDGKHLPSCTRMLLVEEVRAYLRVENSLAEERGDYDDEVCIP